MNKALQNFSENRTVWSIEKLAELGWDNPFGQVRILMMSVHVGEESRQRPVSGGSYEAD